MMNLEQDVEKDSRCLYKYCMIHSPMAMYIIGLIIYSAANLYTSIEQIIRFGYYKSTIYFETSIEGLKIIHFKIIVEG